MSECRDEAEALDDTLEDVRVGLDIDVLARVPAETNRVFFERDLDAEARAFVEEGVRPVVLRLVASEIVVHGRS